MIEKIIESLITNVTNYVVSGLFVYLSYQIRTMQADRKVKAETEAKARTRQEKVDVWLLRSELLRQIKYHLEVGYISANDLSILEQGFSLYEEMGGNGEVKIYMEELRKLPRE